MATIKLNGVEDVRDQIQDELTSLGKCRDSIRSLTEELEEMDGIIDRAIDALKEADDALSEQV